jgi:inner membrane protein
MDSLTQIVLGAAVGEAVLGRKVGNKAMLYGAIAGTIPDLDVISSFFTDTVTALEIHRGFTHSVFFSVVFAPIFAFFSHSI